MFPFTIRTAHQALIEELGIAVAVSGGGGGEEVDGELSKDYSVLENSPRIQSVQIFGEK